MALGRKNWIHIGSPQAGPKVAAILSIMESCANRGLLEPGYFADIAVFDPATIQDTPPLRSRANWRPAFQKSSSTA
ncbi:MAG: hypothetical protein ACLPHI_04595 [Terriglobales bacterium]